MGQHGNKPHERRAKVLGIVFRGRTPIFLRIVQRLGHSKFNWEKWKIIQNHGLESCKILGPKSKYLGLSVLGK